MNIDPDIGGDDDNRSHGGFRPGADRKRKAARTSIQIMANKRREEAARRQQISRYKAKLTEWIDKLKWSHLIWIHQIKYNELLFSFS
ncbi:unnamed protein product [Rotaria sordida]|uniref:Uncharacterized protein n=1 Tax=Rotaria sordida TaxID=392033 RepID=A0A819UYC8_9BILA|nr:unnamed protein product [Rotaria sordida]